MRKTGTDGDSGCTLVAQSPCNQGHSGASTGNLNSINEEGAASPQPLAESPSSIDCHPQSSVHQTGLEPVTFGSVDRHRPIATRCRTKVLRQSRRCGCTLVARTRPWTVSPPSGRPYPNTSARPLPCWPRRERTKKRNNELSPRLRPARPNDQTTERGGEILEAEPWGPCVQSHAFFGDCKRTPGRGSNLWGFHPLTVCPAARTFSRISGWELAAARQSGSFG